MKAKIFIVVGFLLAVVVIVVLTTRGSSKTGPEVDVSAEPSQKPAAPPTPAQTTEISMLYSTEKKEWIEAAAQSFQKDHPEIKVTLVAKGSLDAAQAIVDGKEKPTLYSPADSLVQNLLASDWE